MTFVFNFLFCFLHDVLRTNTYGMLGIHVRTTTRRSEWRGGSTSTHILNAVEAAAGLTFLICLVRLFKKIFPRSS